MTDKVSTQTPQLKCPNCKKDICALSEPEDLPNFCHHCGAYLKKYVQKREAIKQSIQDQKPSIRKEKIAECDIEQAPSEEEILFRIGRYQVLEQIGQGGMGQVLMAYDPACGRRIAIKRIRQSLKKDKVVVKDFSQEDFLREARICSQLSHPSILSIYSIPTKFLWNIELHFCAIRIQKWDSRICSIFMGFKKYSIG